MPRSLMPLTDRDIQSMWELAPSCIDEPIKWHTPLEAGAHNGSHHSNTFMKLNKHGYVDYKQRWSPDEEMNKPRRMGSRGSKVYRISAAGFEYLKSIRPTWRTRAETDAFMAQRTAEIRARKAAQAT